MNDAKKQDSLEAQQQPSWPFLPFAKNNKGLVNRGIDG
jgi:hypothetical protein